MYKIGSSIISIKSVSKVGTNLHPFLYFQRFRFSISALRSDNPPVNHNGSGYSNFHNYFGDSPQFNHLNDFKHLNGDPNGFHEKRTDIYPRTDLNRSNIGSVEGSRIAGQFKHANNFLNFGSDSNGFMKEARNQTTNSARVEPIIGNRDLRNRIKEENTKLSPNKDGNGLNKKKHSYYFECLSKMQESYNQASDAPENKDRNSDFNPFQDNNKEFKLQDFQAGQTAGVSQNKAKRFDNLQCGGEENERKNFKNFPRNFNQNHNDKGSVDGPRIGKQFNPFEKSNLYRNKNKIRPDVVNYPNEFQRKSGFPGQGGGDASGVSGERVGLRTANNLRNFENMQQNGNRVHASNHHNMDSVERPRIGGPFNHFSPDMYPNSNMKDYRENDHHDMHNREGFRMDGPMYLYPNLNEHHGYDYHNMYYGEDFRIGGQLNHFNRPDMFPNSNHIGSIRGHNPNVSQRSNMINGVDNFQGWGGNPDSVYKEMFDLPHEYVNDWRGYGNMPQTFNPYHQNMDNSIEGFRNGGHFNHFNNFQYMRGGGFVKEPHSNEYDSRSMVDMHNFANQYQRYNQVPDFRGRPLNGCQNFRLGSGVHEERFSPNSYQGNNQVPSFRGDGPFNGYQNLVGVGNGVYEERISPNSYQGNNQVPNFRGDGHFNGYQNFRGVGNGVYEERFSPNSCQGNNQASNFVGESPLSGYQNLSGIGNGVYRGRFSPNSEYNGLNQQKLYDVNARGLQNAYQNNQVPKLRGEGFLNGNHNSRGVGNGAYEGRISPNSEYDRSDQQNSYDFNARGLYSMQQNACQRYSQASNFGVAETFQREESKFMRGLDQMNDFQSVNYSQRMGSQYTYRDQYGNMSTRLQQNSNGYIHQFDVGLHGGNSNGHNSVVNNPVSGNGKHYIC